MDDDDCDGDGCDDDGCDDDGCDDDGCDDDGDWAPPEDCTDEELGIGQPARPDLDAAYRRRDREVRQRWRYLPDDPLPVSPPVAPATVGTVLRAVRWHAGLSQRELATSARVPLSAVTRAEQAGGADLRLSTLESVLEVCGLRLVVVDDEGTHLAIPFGQDGRRDRADRRLPAHRAHQVTRLRRGVGLRRDLGLGRDAGPGRDVPPGPES